jgi:hypothetical protein
LTARTTGLWQRTRVREEQVEPSAFLGRKLPMLSLLATVFVIAERPDKCQRAAAIWQCLVSSILVTWADAADPGLSGGAALFDHLEARDRRFLARPLPHFTRSEKCA